MSFQVLLYHGLYRDPQEIRGKADAYVSVEDFRRQVRWMKEDGWALLSLRRCRDLALSKSLPLRTVCVTFDDGKESDLRLAVPVLQEVGAEATFFVVPGWLDTKYTLATSQVKELIGRGMEVGSHSWTHPFMTELNDAALERETAESRLFLEDLLGAPVDSFSYPFGDVDERVRGAVVRAGYKMACCSRRGRNPDSPDWQLLRRWGIPGRAGLEGLQSILHREAPSWRQILGETVKRIVGRRRFSSWKRRWTRRAGGVRHG